MDLPSTCVAALLGKPTVSRSDMFNKKSRSIKVQEIRRYYELKSRTLKNELAQQTQILYDFVIVGGGPAALAFVAGVKSIFPTAKILILEETSTLNPTFEWPGDAVVFNTSVMLFEDETINMHIFPDHDFQLSDFEEFESIDRQHPTGTQISHLAWSYLLKHDPDMLLDATVEKVEKLPDQNNIIHSKGLPPVMARKVVIATGQGRAQIQNIEVENGPTLLKKALDSHLAFFNELGIETYLQAMAYIHANDLKPEKYKDKRVAIVGSGDAGLGLFEILSGVSLPNQSYNINPDKIKPSKLVIYGSPALPPNLKAFREKTKPRYGNIKGLASLFVEPSYPLPSGTKDLRKEIGSSLFFDQNKVVKISLMPEGHYVLEDSAGGKAEFDHVILSNGYAKSLTHLLNLKSEDIYSPSFDQLSTQLETLLSDIKIEGGSYWPGEIDITSKPIFYSEARVGFKLKDSQIYLIANAAGANLLVPDSEALEGTHKDISLASGQPRSSTFTKYSLQHMLPRSFSAGVVLATEIKK